MCHILTTTLSSPTVPNALRATLSRHRLLFEPIDNPFVAEQLRPSEGYFRASGGMCDCGTLVGAGAEEAPSRALPDVAKLRRKGWGTAKIERWLEQQRANAERRTRVEAEHAASGRDTPTLEQWSAALHEIVSSNAVQWVGLMLHAYEGTLTGEQITFQRETVRVPALDAEFLLGLDEDTLYEFRAPAG